MNYKFKDKDKLYPFLTVLRLLEFMPQGTMSSDELIYWMLGAFPRIPKLHGTDL